MDPKLELRLLKSEFSSLLELLSRHGLAFEACTEQEFEALPLTDQRRIVRSMRDLARTPDI
jgi:hypothetical protein